MLALLAGLLALYNSAKSKESELGLLRQQNQPLTRLRAENDYLRQQRDILKKALGILSAEVPSNVSR